jgi:hypothetical protein
LPIAVCGNRVWRERILDVATRLIFGGSPGSDLVQEVKNGAGSGSKRLNRFQSRRDYRR